MNLTRAQIETCLHYANGEDAQGVNVPKYMLVALCEMALKQESAEAIVKELVRLKDLKDTLSIGPVTQQGLTTHVELRTEYNRCKPLAWSSARALVKGKA
jgi:hypothetical protein